MVEIINDASASRRSQRKNKSKIKKIRVGLLNLSAECRSAADVGVTRRDLILTFSSILISDWIYSKFHRRGRKKKKKKSRVDR